MNLDSKPIDDFVYFFEKNKDKKKSEDFATSNGIPNSNNAFISSSGS